MPHRVDHDQRRRRISEALARIASTRGLDDVGLREVAAEAGISLGQLQHYFSSKDEMLGFALADIGRQATQRVEQRLAAMTGPKTPYAIIRESLQEMLPLSAESRLGLQVYAAYTARAVHDARLRAGAGGPGALTALFADQLRRAIENGQVSPQRDPDTEAATLLCLANGLTTYVLLEVYTAADAQHIVDSHLANLFRPRGAT